MNDYLLLLLQLVILGATALLFITFKRSRNHTITGGLRAAEMVELQSALNEMLDELQEIATRVNMQLADTTSQASVLKQEIDQRIERLDKLNRESAQEEKPEVLEEKKPIPLGNYRDTISPKQKDLSEIGRGEQELLHRLQMWQKN